MGETPFSSFPKWAKVIGGVMTCPGIELGNPCLPHPSEFRNEDPELAAMTALFSECHETDSGWWSMQEIYAAIEAGIKEVEAFGWFAEHYFDDGTLNRRTAGRLLRRWEGRKVNGITMAIDKRDSNPSRHKVRFSK